eukprot:CAMPEP_0177215172 /NCGR_PEP_ID=MMETSP0367-20130122/34078_1 /TAXON_ID=447022 ORGANISM="Scrippsiella hangoei-like, Strain SHHI-4" /NCGR_SAMPLE_ID=MMETSP0367 /ASSEMBLY_ACC=CAM_ASM_000362 /LENGTH=45 /DNA_ID= /DNA_START= /DNA_END= /DNA_ORIENTATION=
MQKPSARQASRLSATKMKSVPRRKAWRPSDEDASETEEGPRPRSH